VRNDLQARTMRRVSLRIVPFIMLLYFVAFIDRVNIGFAALTMNKDLALSPSVFGFGAGIFFWGYFLFEVPSNVVLDKVGARLWIARVMITWGLVSGAMALVQGQTGFYVLRFLLGAAEAGFFPGIILYLSYWFPARQRATVTALFMAAAPLSTILGSPLSAALLEMHGSWHSDRTNERTWHVVIACLVAATGHALAGSSSGVAAVVAALVLVNVGISAAKPPLWSMPTLFLAGPAAASGIATINSIGNLGGFVGPDMIGWIKEQTGSFEGGLYFVAALLLLSATLTLLLARSIRHQPAAAGAH